MKQFRLFPVLMAALVMLITSCQQDPLLTIRGPHTYNFSREGGTESFSFSSNQDWTISTSDSWITVSPSSGTPVDGEIMVTITCSANDTFDDRSATVTIRTNDLSETITVTQNTGFGILVSPSSFDLTSAAQTIEIKLQKNVQYSITIDDAGVDWIKVGGTKALSTDIVTFHIAENTGYDGREGVITFKQIDGPMVETVRVKQSSREELFVEKKSYWIGREGGFVAVEVMANVEFEVETEANWVHYVQTKALSKSTVELSVDENMGDTTRETSINIKQKNGELCATVKIIQGTGEEPEETGLFFSKGVELMCLIWKLAGASEYNQCEIIEVNESVNEYFSSMVNHEAVLLAKEYYYSHNICYDAVTAYGLHLVINTDGTISFNPDYLEYDADGFFLRWSPQQREKMLKAVNDFYKESRFEEWFSSLRPLFDEAKSAFEKVCNVDYKWYESFFGTIKNPSHQIILSFLIGYNNNGLSVLLKDGTIMSSPVMGSVLGKHSGELYYGEGMLEVIIHEFSHPYCNPLISAYWDSMEEKANEVYKVVQSQMVSQAYGSPMTMMCETFVRSSVIRYFLSHFSYCDRNGLVNQQEGLGFKLVGTFVDALALREKNQGIYPTMNDFMPELIQAMNNYVIETYSGAYPEYNNPSSPNLLPGVFSVGPNSQVQFTKSNVFWNGTELKFEDNPMNYPAEWNPSHIGHFYWTTTLKGAIADDYAESGQSVSDHFFCDGSDANHTLSVEGITGLRVLKDYKDGEIDYLLYKRKNADRLFKYPVSIKGVGSCLVLAPDGYTGSISDSYDSASWAVAEDHGLVCLAPNGRRSGTVILACTGQNGYYWSGSAKEDSSYHAYMISYSDSIYHYPSYSSRNNGFSLHLVKDVK